MGQKSVCSPPPRIISGTALKGLLIQVCPCQVAIFKVFDVERTIFSQINLHFLILLCSGVYELNKLNYFHVTVGWAFACTATCYFQQVNFFLYPTVGPQSCFYSGSNYTYRMQLVYSSAANRTSWYEPHVCILKSQHNSLLYRTNQ